MPNHMRKPLKSLSTNLFNMIESVTDAPTKNAELNPINIICIRFSSLYFSIYFNRKIKNMFANLNTRFKK